MCVCTVVGGWVVVCIASIPGDLRHQLDQRPTLPTPFNPQPPHPNKRFMTTPGSHNDVYAGTCHRMFFSNYVTGKDPKKCADNDGHNVRWVVGCGCVVLRATRGCGVCTHPPTHQPDQQVYFPSGTHTRTHTNKHTHTPKKQVDTIDGLVPLVPIALSRLGVASERAALKKDIKVHEHGYACYACPCLGFESSRGKGGLASLTTMTPRHSTSTYIHIPPPTPGLRLDEPRLPPAGGVRGGVRRDAAPGHRGRKLGRDLQQGRCVLRLGWRFVCL